MSDHPMEPLRSVMRDAFRAQQALAIEEEAAEAKAAGVTVADLRKRREDEKRAQEAEAERERVIGDRLRALASLPLTAADCEAIARGQHVDTRPVSHVQRWLADESAPAFLVLLGGVGTGKTYATGLAALEHGGTRGYLKGRSVEFCRAADLGKRADPWRADLEAGVRPLNLDASLLILDDLGAERDADARFHEGLFRLVDARLDRRTIITANLAKADIRARYGERIADRLNHVGRAVEIGGKSLRRQGAGL